MTNVVTQSEEVRHVPGAGTDIVIPSGAPGDVIRHWVAGDAYPRIVIDPANSSILTGDGTVPPTVTIGTGQQTLAAANKYTDDEFGTLQFYVQSYVQQAIAQALGPAGVKAPPGPPTAVVVTATGTTASVAFTPGPDGGDAVTVFTARAYSIVNGIPLLSSVAVATNATSPISMPGLQPGIVYVATVTATNPQGTSVESTFSAQFTASPAAPDAPVIGAANVVGTTSVIVSFTPGSNGGSPITAPGYTVTCTSTDGGTTRTATSMTGSPIQVDNLTTAKNYNAVVKAHNAQGDSTNSGAVNFTAGAVAGNAAIAKFGVFCGEPNSGGVGALKNFEAWLGHTAKQTQMNAQQTSTGTGAAFFTDNIWGCTSDNSTVVAAHTPAQAGDGSKCIGFDATAHARVQEIMDIPLAFGTAAQGGGQGQNAAYRLAHLEFVRTGTVDGTNAWASAYKLQARNYYRDRNLSTTVNGAQDLGTGAFLGGTGVLTVASNANLTIGVPCWVDAPTGVFKVSFTGKAGAGGTTTLTGCTATRATVGGGSGSNTVANGAYVGSGTGSTNFFGRFGWENDGDWYPWGTFIGNYNGALDTSITAAGDRGQAQLSAKFVATYKVVVDAHRAYGWDSFTCDLTHDQTLFQARELDVLAPLATATTADGAGKYVHIYGMDVYDDGGGGQSANYNSSTNTWTNPAAVWSFRLSQLQLHRDLAIKYGLQVGYGEWACVSGTGNGNDDPTFIQGMFDWQNSLPADVATPPAHTPGSLAYHTYFNVFPTFSLSSGKPNALAKFKTLYGA